VSKMRICNSEHSIMIPLIWTFAFMGSECWCPVCGYTSGMLGAGEIVGETDILKKRLAFLEAETADYLRARKTLICSSLEWMGKRIKPQDLPKHEIKRLTGIVNNWNGIDESSVPQQKSK